MMTYRNVAYEAVSWMVERLIDSGEDPDRLLAVVDRYELLSLVMAEDLYEDDVDQTELTRQSEALYRDLMDRY